MHLAFLYTHSLCVFGICKVGVYRLAQGLRGVRGDAQQRGCNYEALCALDAQAAVQDLQQSHARSQVRKLSLHLLCSSLELLWHLKASGTAELVDMLLNLCSLIGALHTLMRQHNL